MELAINNVFTGLTKISGKTDKPGVNPFLDFSCTHIFFMYVYLTILYYYIITPTGIRIVPQKSQSGQPINCALSPTE